MIVGLCGLKGNGKNSVANIIMKHYPEWKDVSIAAPMKDAAAAMFGWSRELLEGDTNTSREWREQEDCYWTQRLGRTITPRNVLQQFGRELVQNQFTEEFWVHRLERSVHKLLESEESKVLVTDVRFPSEIEMIKSRGGKICHVHCGLLPQWFLDFENNGVRPSDIHESEYLWASYKPDTVIHAPYKDLELLEYLVMEKYNELLL